MEYFQKVDTSIQAHILRKKILTSEVEGLDESLAVLAAKIPHFYATSDAAGTTYSNAGIYASVPYNSMILDNGIVYNGVDAGLFSHQIAEGFSGVYKVSLHAEIKAISTTLSYPTRFRFDLTKNNSNVGIMSTGIASIGNESVDMVEGITDDNGDTAIYEDRYNTGTLPYGRTILRNGFGLVQASVNDIIRIRTYVWSTNTRTQPSLATALDTPISIRARVLVEKIW